MCPAGGVTWDQVCLVGGRDLRFRCVLQVGVIWCPGVFKDECPHKQGVQSCPCRCGSPPGGGDLGRRCVPQVGMNQDPVVSHKWECPHRWGNPGSRYVPQVEGPPQVDPP